MTSDKDEYCCIMEILAKEFKRELLAARRDRAVDWRFAKDALRLLAITDGLNRPGRVIHDLVTTTRQSASFAHAAKEVWKIIRFLMMSFDVLNLRDTNLAADVLRHEYYFAHIYETKFHLTRIYRDFVIPDTYDRLWCLCEATCCTDFMLTEEEFRQLLRTPYNIPYSLNRGEETKQIHKHVVWCAIREGHEPLVSGFLKYGVMFFPAHSYVAEQLRHHKALVQLLVLIRNYRPPVEVRRRLVFLKSERKPKINKTEHRDSIILRVLELLVLELKARRVRRERLEPDGPSQKERPRLGRYAEDRSTLVSIYFRCLRRAFRTIPEPFVSSDEVREILRYSYFKIWDEKELFISEIIEELEELYPEAKGPATPRSLQHLSRCQVRENLRQSGELPHGIKELGLTTLQQYLALEE